MSSEHAMSSEQTRFTDHSLFTDHTIESAPAAARRAMTATESRLGYLPSAIARMATSPDLLDGFLKLSEMFEGTTLDPIAREVLIMTIATRNGCHLCVAMHTGRLTALNADAALIAALREGAAAPDPRLDSIRVFTLRVLATSAIRH
jgi:AhpD family alkylhydroperoxidase